MTSEAFSEKGPSLGSGYMRRKSGTIGLWRYSKRLPSHLSKAGSLALGSPGWLFVCLAPCQNCLVDKNMVIESVQAIGKSLFSKPDQGREIIGPVSIVHSRYWVLFNRLSLRQFKLEIQPCLKDFSMICVECLFLSQSTDKVHLFFSYLLRLLTKKHKWST